MLTLASELFLCPHGAWVDRLTLAEGEALLIQFILSQVTEVSPLSLDPHPLAPLLITNIPNSLNSLFGCHAESASILELPFGPPFSFRDVLAFS